MTVIRMTKQGPRYCLEASGHATSSAEAPPPSALAGGERYGASADEGVQVCAAVSMLAGTLALALEQVPGIDRDSVHTDMGEGYARISARGQGPVKTLFQAAYCGAVGLQMTHPDRVQVQADPFFKNFFEFRGAI